MLARLLLLAALAAGVDLLDTDKLGELRGFLLSPKP
jgi:hypothetical protein